jgi:hypothetical protein
MTLKDRSTAVFAGLLATFAAGACSSSASGGRADAGAACTMSIAAYCAGRTDAECAPTWSAVLADTSFCGGQSTVGEMDYACQPYQVRLLNDIDVGTHSYYDANSGALLAIVTVGMGGGGCLGGSTNFTAPANCNGGSDASSSSLWRTCADAGADASAASNQ